MMVHLVRFAVPLLLVLAACGGPKSKPRMVVTDSKVELVEPITFTGEAEIAPSAIPALDAIAETLVGNPSILLVEVQVYVTDGDEATRQQRADKRAQVVVDYLIGKQVAAERLQAKGYVTPSPDRTTPTVFLILKRRE
jgi:outer membrane protein OmpA-like peptidoglycan-associated protein